MATKQTDPTIRDLTLAEIARQVASYSRKRRDVAAELAEIFRSRKAGVPQEPALSDHAKAARERAKQLLNGHAPASLILPPATTREEELEVERDALDVVLEVLSRSEIAARTVACVQFVEERGPEWRALCRELALTAFRLRALERRAQRMTDELPGPVAGLALAEFIGGGHTLFADYALLDFETAAVRDGIVTEAEIRQLERSK